MASNSRDRHFPTLRSRSPSPKRSETRTGFADLDPAALGFTIPEWLTLSSPPLEAPSGTTAPATSDGLTAFPQPPPNDDSATNSGASSRTLIEGIKVVCICKGIKKRIFWQALDEGACTREEINQVTGSGSGSCRGRRCGPRILDMLRDFFQS
jgi:bacterioferritin-associated ferredoxin